MAKKIHILLLACIFSLLVCLPANAAILRWNFDDVQGGDISINGFFDYNTVTSEIPNSSVHVTGAIDPTLTLDTFLGPVGSGSDFLAFGSVIGATLLLRNTSDPTNFFADLALNNPIPLDGSTFEVSHHGTADLTGFLSPAPLPASMSMFGFAMLGLAAFAVWHRRRNV